MAFHFAKNQFKQFLNVDLLHKMECKLCPLYNLPNNRYKDIPPHGFEGPDGIYVLGMAPGYEESNRNEFFTGPSGHYLKSCLTEDQVRKIRFGNILRTRPLKDIPPFEAVEACRPSVEKDIIATRPRLVFLLGNEALQWAMHAPTQPSINAWRGHPFPFRLGDHSMWGWPIFHPAYVLRDNKKNKGLEELFQMDISNAYKFLKRELVPEVQDPAHALDDCHTILNPEEIKRELVGFYKDPYIVIDLETSDTKRLGKPYASGSKILTISIGNKHRSIAFPWKHPQAQWNPKDFKSLWEFFHKFIRNVKQVKKAHMASFEQEWLVYEYNDPQIVRANWHDTMSPSFVIGLGGSAKKEEAGRAERLFKGLLSLDNLCMMYYGFFLKSVSNLDRANLEEEDMMEVLKYNSGDSLWDDRIDEKLMADVSCFGLEAISKEHDRRVPTMVLTQWKGLVPDVAKAKVHCDKVEKDIIDIYTKVHNHPSIIEYRTKYGNFNIGAAADVAYLFKYLGFNVIRKDPKTGEDKISSDDVILKAIDHPLSKLVLSYRELAKLKSTYLDIFIEGNKGYIVYPDGKLHPEFTTFFTSTGRTSSNKPNCFPPEVEVLTDVGWVHWDSVTKTMKLAQYDLISQEIDFVEPLKYISYDYNGDLLSITTEEHLDILCTEDHGFYTRGKNSKKKIRYLPAKEFPKWDKIPQAGYYKLGREHLRQSQITLLAALQADCYAPSAGFLEWGLVRPRKIKRLRDALVAEGIPFTEGIRHKARGDLRFYVAKRNVPSWLYGKKHFGPWILSLDEESLNFLSKELWHWDGGMQGNDYCTDNKNDIDWAQIILTLTGQAATFRTRESNTAMFVTCRNVNYCYTSNHIKTSVPYIGKVYCATMPKGTVIVRHAGRAVVAGNCQNFPSKRNKNIRDIIVAPPGYIFASCDFGQIEYRVLIMASKDPTLVGYVWSGQDIHAEWALKIAKKYPKRVGESIVTRWLQADPTTLKDTDKLFKTFRDMVKNAFVFAAFYGAGIPKLSEELGIPREYVMELYHEFWQEFHVVKEWHQWAYDFYAKHGYIETLTGRRRYAPIRAGEIINAPIQGGASDIVIDGMNRLSEHALESGKMQYQPIMNIHDDLSFYLPIETWEDDLRFIIQMMVDCKYPFINVPLSVEASTGPDWFNQKLYGVFDNAVELKARMC